MAKLLKLRRGTDTQHSTFTGAEGEVTVNTTNDSLHVHDGTTAGGTELAKADLSNVDGSLSNNLGFADNTQVQFGTDNDLQIYHDGSASYITDTGAGPLYIRGTNLNIGDSGGYNFITCNDTGTGGTVYLYHEANEKLATTSTGINVTGNVVCDGLTVDGAFTQSNGAGLLTIQDDNNTGNTVTAYTQGKDSAGTEVWAIGQVSTGNQNLYVKNSISAPIVFNTGGTNRVIIQSDGHLVPNTDNTYDLGTSSTQWRNGYFDGTVNCDGLVTDGNFTLTNGDMTIGSSTDTGVNVRVDFEDSGGVGQFNLNAHGTAEFKMLHNRSGVTNGGIPNSAAGFTSPQTCPIYFANSGTARAYFDTNGNFRPAANNTYDLGSGSEQWRNAYFSGSVTFDNDQRFGFVPQELQTGNITMTADQAGTVIDTAYNVTVPNNVFAQNSIVTIYNNSSSAITITQASGLIMRLVGDGGTGNRTLDGYGMATIWFRAGNHCTISGIGVS